MLFVVLFIIHLILQCLILFIVILDIITIKYILAICVLCKLSRWVLFVTLVVTFLDALRFWFAVRLHTFTRFLLVPFCFHPVCRCVAAILTPLTPLRSRCGDATPLFRYPITVYHGLPHYTVTRSLPRLLRSLPLHYCTDDSRSRCSRSACRLFGAIPAAAFHTCRCVDYRCVVLPLMSGTWLHDWFIVVDDDVVIVVDYLLILFAM